MIHNIQSSPLHPSNYDSNDKGSSPTPINYLAGSLGSLIENLAKALTVPSLASNLAGNIKGFLISILNTIQITYPTNSDTCSTIQMLITFVQACDNDSDAASTLVSALSIQTSMTDTLKAPIPSTNPLSNPQQYVTGEMFSNITQGSLIMGYALLMESGPTAPSADYFFSQIFLNFATQFANIAPSSARPNPTSGMQMVLTQLYQATLGGNPPLTVITPLWYLTTPIVYNMINDSEYMKTQGQSGAQDLINTINALSFVNNNVLANGLGIGLSPQSGYAQLLAALSAGIKNNTIVNNDSPPSGAYTQINYMLNSENALDFLWLPSLTTPAANVTMTINEMFAPLYACYQQFESATTQSAQIGAIEAFKTEVIESGVLGNLIRYVEVDYNGGLLPNSPNTAGLPVQLQALNSPIWNEDPPSIADVTNLFNSLSNLLSGQALP